MIIYELWYNRIWPDEGRVNELEFSHLGIWRDTQELCDDILNRSYGTNDFGYKWTTGYGIACNCKRLNYQPLKGI